MKLEVGMTIIEKYNIYGAIVYQSYVVTRVTEKTAWFSRKNNPNNGYRSKIDTKIVEEKIGGYNTELFKLDVSGKNTSDFYISNDVLRAEIRKHILKGKAKQHFDNIKNKPDENTIEMLYQYDKLTEENKQKAIAFIKSLQ